MRAAAKRTTATFEPYYWEAYSEIVNPRSFDSYLVRKWVPDLGPEAFTLLKVLRSHCYHNPDTGVTRDTCELSMDDLAKACRMSKRSLFRLLETNEPLKQFVQRIPRYIVKDGAPKRAESRFRVCMDDPVHPDDMARYEEMKAQKEQSRGQQMPKVIIERECQIGTHKAPMNAKTDTHECQSGSHMGDMRANLAQQDSVPSGDSLLKENTASPMPGGNPRTPVDKAEGDRNPAPPSIDRPENRRGLALVRETLKRKQAMAAPKDLVLECEEVRAEIAASLRQDSL